MQSKVTPTTCLTKCTSTDVEPDPPVVVVVTRATPDTTSMELVAVEDAIGATYTNNHNHPKVMPAKCSMNCSTPNLTVAAMVSCTSTSLASICQDITCTTDIDALVCPKETHIKCSTLSLDVKGGIHDQAEVMFQAMTAASKVVPAYVQSMDNFSSRMNANRKLATLTPARCSVKWHGPHKHFDVNPWPPPNFNASDSSRWFGILIDKHFPLGEPLKHLHIMLVPLVWDPGDSKVHLHKILLNDWLQCQYFHLGDNCWNIELVISVGVPEELCVWVSYIAVAKKEACVDQNKGVSYSEEMRFWCELYSHCYISARLIGKGNYILEPSKDQPTCLGPQNFEKGSFLFTTIDDVDRYNLDIGTVVRLFAGNLKELVKHGRGFDIGISIMQEQIDGQGIHMVWFPGVKCSFKLRLNTCWVICHLEPVSMIFVLAPLKCGSFLEAWSPENAPLLDESWVELKQLQSCVQIEQHKYAGLASEPTTFGFHIKISRELACVHADLFQTALVIQPQRNSCTNIKIHDVLVELSFIKQEHSKLLKLFQYLHILALLGWTLIAKMEVHLDFNGAPPCLLIAAARISAQGHTSTLGLLKGESISMLQIQWDLEFSAIMCFSYILLVYYTEEWFWPMENERNKEKCNQ
ncbi:hypothetical protein OsI_22492 [Oryza sativa Indica Group]|uniref:Uncharacterized protein n=1 Tax=Oryza sativa subsp. indica TaxID=39946 RepID=A2YBK9_ORYSI|nr:hypothetical protein OsI_22492 [Oryza sativa Indica Group]